MTDKALEDVRAQMISVRDDQATPPAAAEWLNGLLERLEDVGQIEERFLKGYPIPVSLGDLADEYSVVRQKRLDMEKEAKAVKDRETELFDSALSTLNESSDTGAMGKFYAVQRVEKEVNNVKDWPTLWAYIRENNAFDLLGKSINQKAVRDQIEAGEVIPGVAQEIVPTLSFTKVKK